MRYRNILGMTTGLVLLAATGLLGQSASIQTWSLPQGTAVKDNGPRTYRFVVDYNTGNTRGEIMSRQRVTGEYTRGLAGGGAMWKNVTQANAIGAGPFAVAEKQDFMEGFRYRNDLAGSMTPEFFKGFPPMAFMERNLVWDTGMMEWFGQGFFDRLKLNEPYRIISDEKMSIPGLGTFQNHDVLLEWVGRSQRNGHECALIKYQAFFNPVQIATGGMSLDGRSDYWGEIWISLESKQVEFGTLYESVVGELKLPGQELKQNVNIFRSGTLEPVDTK